MARLAKRTLSRKAPSAELRQMWYKQFTRDGQSDPWRTTCASAVLAHFKIPKTRFRYAQSFTDVCRVLRYTGEYSLQGFSPAGITVGQLRLVIQNGDLGRGKFIVRVPDHIILLNNYGRTIVDTDPRKRDRRRVTHLARVS